jgi:hypothetical protein
VKVGVAGAAKFAVRAAAVPQVKRMPPEDPVMTEVGLAVRAVQVVVRTAAVVVTAGNVCVKRLMAAAAEPITETAIMARIVLLVRVRDIFISPPT